MENDVLDGTRFLIEVRPINKGFLSLTLTRANKEEFKTSAGKIQQHLINVNQVILYMNSTHIYRRKKEKVMEEASQP